MVKNKFDARLIIKLVKQFQNLNVPNNVNLFLRCCEHFSHSNRLVTYCIHTLCPYPYVMQYYRGWVLFKGTSTQKLRRTSTHCLKGIPYHYVWKYFLTIKLLYRDDVNRSIWRRPVGCGNFAITWKTKSDRYT